jgi:hypothetical protein
MKTCLLLGLLLPASLVATAAVADDKAACLDAATKAQRFKDTHKLVEAREQLRICAAAECPAVVQTDCANWLAEVEKALPTVVVIAKSGAGADLVDVKVTVDGHPFVTKLDGQAIPMNAGPHTFHFEGADGTLDQQVVVTEGEKSQKVAIVLGAPPPAPDTSGSSSTWKTAGWVWARCSVSSRWGTGTVPVATPTTYATRARPAGSRARPSSRTSVGSREACCSQAERPWYCSRRAGAMRPVLV